MCIKRIHCINCMVIIYFMHAMGSTLNDLGLELYAGISHLKRVHISKDYLNNFNAIYDLLSLL